jgi:two-component system, OmpR family, phosphate regulon sensor histidine kinase PhoR
MCNFPQLISKNEMKKNKHIKASRIGKGQKIGIIFVLVALLPALFYSAYEVSSLSSTEELIQSIYSKQLDVILFSINQYALDAAQSWSGEINTLLITSQPSRVDSATRIFLNKREVIHGMFYADSTGHSSSFVSRQIKEKTKGDEDISVSSLQNQSATIEKLLRYASAGYRKIEPVVIGDSVSGQGLMLMFVTSSRFPEKKIAGFLIDVKSFLTEVLKAKLEQAAGEEFLLAVFNRRNHNIVFSTTAVEITELREVKDLWLFPDYSIGIRLKGKSVEDVVRARSERNLILIGILDVLLIGAIWLVYRTLKKEMELVRLKGDFVSNVSHELRTPLSLIRMFTETLSMKRVQTEKKKHEYYETILHETERLTHLINNILNFSRMEAGKKQYYFELIVLNNVVTNVLKTYTSHLEHEGFLISVQLTENLPAIHADREAITEALINIFDNAVKYSTAEKYIRIKTGKTESMIYVEVEDHGIGIDKHHHKKIFETFYRVSTGLTNNIKGSGLGLSLVSHIMDAHGGMIELESEPGKGSIFRLLFPIVNRSDLTYKG